jgi:rubrerythrin
MTSSDNKKLLAALEANWQAEMEGHYTYTAFAKSEGDPQRRNALRGLAAAEKHHADLWAGRMQELGAPAPQYARDLFGSGRLVSKSSGRG